MASRLIWADALKGILIILVIVGHCIAGTIGNDQANRDYLWCLIYSFHMPAFIAISGYLSYKKDHKAQIKWGGVIARRFRQLLIPFFAWSALFFIVREGTLSSYYQCILFPNMTFWFLWALFFIVTFFTLAEYLSHKIRVLHNRTHIMVAIVCVLFAGLTVVFKDLKYFGVSYVLYYFLFYSIGFFIHKYTFYINKSYLTAAAVLVWFILGSYWNPHELPEPIVKYIGNLASLRYAYKFVVALVAVIGMFSLAPRFLNKESILNMMFCSLGTVSLGIYTFHLIFVNHVTNLFSNYVEQEWLVILLSSIVLTIVSYFMIKLLQQWRWSRRILLGKI